MTLLHHLLPAFGWLLPRVQSAGLVMTSSGTLLRAGLKARHSWRASCDTVKERSGMIIRIVLFNKLYIVLKSLHDF